MTPVRVLLVGVGGFGAYYARELLGAHKREGVRFAGAVDPYARSSPEYERMAAAGIPLYDSLDAFFGREAAELAVVCTPIHLHERQAVFCMERGAGVLIEKPIAATVASALRIIAARDRTGAKLGIGYQWCCDSAMRRMKADADAGAFGALEEMRAMVLWPRDRAYYARGLRWAGRMHSPDGEPIFDNVASNATAHQLEAMLYLAGAGAESVQADMLRANDIETFDTVAMRARLAGGARLTFVASHAAGAEHVQEPMFEYAFARATISYGGWGEAGNNIVARFSGGRARDYGTVLPADSALTKLWLMVDAIRGQTEPPCGAETALLHTLLMEKLRADCAAPKPFPGEMTREREGLVWVPGLADALHECYASRRLLRETRWGEFLHAGKAKET